MTWSTPEGLRALAVTCPRCEAEPGEWCKKSMGRAKNPHAARVRLGLTVAAHSDPLLDDPWFGPVTACGFCGVRPQRHRIVDAIAGRLEAGEDAGEVAADYVMSLEKVGVVERWAKAWPGAWL